MHPPVACVWAARSLPARSTRLSVARRMRRVSADRAEEDDDDDDDDEDEDEEDEDEERGVLVMEMRKMVCERLERSFMLVAPTCR
jgi:hypothetical protein